MPKRTDGRTRKMVRVWVDQRICDELYLIFLDPFTKKPQYGALSQLTEDLYIEWIKKYKQQQEN